MTKCPPLLSGLVDRFAHLKAGLAAVLVYVGVKMALAGWVHVPPLASLAVIAGILAAAVLLSLGRRAPAERVRAAGAARVHESA